MAEAAATTKKILAVGGLSLDAGDGPRVPPTGNRLDAAYRHDAAGRLAAARAPGGAELRFAYDGRGNLTGRSTANGHQLRFSYDDEDRLTAVDDNDGWRARYEYRRSSVVLRSPAAVTELIHGDGGQLAASRQTVDGVTAETAYDFAKEGAPGPLRRLRPAGSRRWLRWLRYDDDPQTKTLCLRVDGGPVYATLNATGLALGNGVREHRRTEPGRGEVEVRDAGERTLLRLRYCFDDTLRISEWNGRPLSYDGEGRLTEIGGDPSSATVYTYDADGNRLGASDGGGERRYEYDADGRLVRLEGRGGGEVAYGYDDEGNRTARRSGGRLTEYLYDSEQRLVEVRDDGATHVRYAYDALGRRVKKTAGGRTRIFHWDREGRLVAETDAAGRALSTYLWLEGRCIGRIAGAVGEPVAEWYHNDHLGTAWASTGPRGELLWRRRQLDPFGEAVGVFFAGRRRDSDTGLYDFGSRDYDPESARFLIPDSYTWAPDDPRLLFSPRRDAWGERRRPAEVVEGWLAHPQLANRYAFCLNDPVNHVDPDGHSAWWFFLTIPSSLTWAMPNTVVALFIVLGNLLMEIIGWLGWIGIAIAKKDGSGKSYPWGRKSQTSANPRNPFDLDQRSHFWLGATASARLGVPWTLFNGSFFADRPFTLGNWVLIDHLTKKADEADTDPRFVVPKDPDVQLNRLEALYAHELQHVFQYALFGPLFHALPLPPLIRLADGGLVRDKWWEQLDIGGLVWSVSWALWALTGGKLHPDQVEQWLNPATWWTEVVPGRWMEIIAEAWNYENWMPAIGVYEWSSLWFARQEASWFERNAGANSGDVYRTVVEVEKSRIYVGKVTRVVGSDAAYPPSTTGVTPTTVSFRVTPAVPSPVGGGGNLDPQLLPHSIDLDVRNTAPIRVVNGSAFYFHSLQAGEFEVEGTGSVTNHRESVTIKVRDVDADVENSVFVCSRQTIEVDGDPDATYSLRLQSNLSGATLNGMTYTAGDAPGRDVIEVVARYQANIPIFRAYGDNGLAGYDYVVKTLEIDVENPRVTPSAAEVFVGGTVEFETEPEPQAGRTTSNVSGSRFDLDHGRFHAGRGPIATEATETVTLEYGCKDLTFDIKVKPIRAVANPAEVDGGGSVQIGVTGGIAPHQYEISVASSNGAEVDDDGRYTAGSADHEVVDTVTVTDQDGDGGRARVDIRIRAMTAAVDPATVATGGEARVTAERGAEPYDFEITHRKSEGSTIDDNGVYTAGTTSESDTVTVTDRNGTQVRVTIVVS